MNKETGAFRTGDRSHCAIINLRSLICEKKRRASNSFPQFLTGERKDVEKASQEAERRRMRRGNSSQKGKHSLGQKRKRKSLNYFSGRSALTAITKTRETKWSWKKNARRRSYSADRLPSPQLPHFVCMCGCVSLIAPREEDGGKEILLLLSLTWSSSTTASVVSDMIPLGETMCPVARSQSYTKNDA